MLISFSILLLIHISWNILGKRWKIHKIYIMSIWGIIYWDIKKCSLFHKKLTFNIQSMCKFPWFSKSRCLFTVYWKNVVVCCTWLFSFRWNNCSSHNFNAIHLFRNWEETGWFVLQNVPLLGLEHSGSGPVPVLGLLEPDLHSRGELQASEWASSVL